MELFGPTFELIERKLDLHLKRHALLASNVANSETPGYKARELDFAGTLERTLNKEKTGLFKTHSRHLELSSFRSPHVVLDHTGAVGANGNNVDIDINMGKISSNAGGYTGAARLMTMYLRVLRRVARGGSGGM